MSMLSDMQADTAAIIGDWSEVFHVARITTTYNDERMPVTSYATSDSFAGDMQPSDAQLMRAEEGLKYRTDKIIYGLAGIDVLENDQITETDGTVWYVNYIHAHEDHTEVYLRRTEGQVT